jgi:hypothetical protein
MGCWRSRWPTGSRREGRCPSRPKLVPNGGTGWSYIDGKYGELIVQFLRLNSETDAQDFQQKHSRYFPPEFWTWQLPSDAERYAGAVFLPSFDGSRGSTKPQRPAFPYWLAYRNVLRAAWASGFDDEYVVRLLNVPTRADDSEDYLKNKAPAISRTRTLEFNPVHPFQHDLLTLVRSTWRAKQCDLCKEPFVADRPSRHFCPERYAPNGDPELSCYKQHRRAVKRDLWNKHGKKWRKPNPKRQNRKRGSARAKSSRRTKR